MSDTSSVTMRRSGRHLRTGATAFAALVIAASMLVAPVLAGHDTAVKSYTGCLTNQGGTLTLIREGGSPAKPCPNGSVEAHFSGGDITSVIAGTGLTGGGTNGSVTVSLDPKYALRQDCADGQVVKWDDTAESWKCAADNDTTYTAGTGLQLDGTEFSVDPGYALPDCALGESATVVGDPSALFGVWGCVDKADADEACPTGQFANGIDENGNLECASSGGSSAGGIELWDTRAAFGNAPEGSYNTVASVDLPAGTFLVIATGTATDDVPGDDLVEVTCTLSPGIGSVYVTNHDGNLPGTAVVVQEVFELADATSVAFQCTSHTGSDHIERIVMTAFKIATLH